MEWTKLNIEDLPENEVLAGNFKKGTYGYKEKLIGYLSDNIDYITCENENELLNNCTHYIDINKENVES